MGRIATRASRLALVQAELVRSALAGAYPSRRFQLVEVTTRGDRLQEVSLEKVEGKGFFTDALERALKSGRADIAAHSLKDLPTDLPDGFSVPAVLPRGDPRDAIVSPHGGLRSLPEGAVVGTDASRRRAQLSVVRPDLEFRPVRGNVPTRLGKLERGEYDALILAVAGLQRLGLDGVITEYLDPAICLPAPGQGAIALETLAGGEWEELAAAVDDRATSLPTRAERAFLSALGGGCQAPVGALAELEGDVLRLTGVLVEAGRPARVEEAAPAESPEAVGRRAAERLLGALTTR
jgi:hydroxymethylbilane synthase